MPDCEDLFPVVDVRRLLVCRTGSGSAGPPALAGAAGASLPRLRLLCSLSLLRFPPPPRYLESLTLSPSPSTCPQEVAWLSRHAMGLGPMGNPHAPCRSTASTAKEIFCWGLGWDRYQGPLNCLATRAEQLRRRVAVRHAPDA